MNHTATLHGPGRFTQHLLASLGQLFGAGRAPRSRTESASMEAQQVRHLAQAYAHTDPGFAADLYAAAARHEGLNDD